MVKSFNRENRTKARPVWSQTWLLELRILSRWLILPVALGLIAGLLDVGYATFLGREEIAVTADLKISLYYGEILLPLATGWVCANVALGDVARELLTVSQTPFWQFCLHRAVLVLCAMALLWTAAFSSVFLALQLRDPEPLAVRYLLGGLASLLFFGACGFAAAILFANALAGSAFTTMLWCGALLALRSRRMIMLLHPFLTVADAQHPQWTTNRLLMVTLALLLVSWGCWHLRDMSRLQVPLVGEEDL